MTDVDDYPEPTPAGQWKGRAVLGPTDALQMQAAMRQVAAMLSTPEFQSTVRRAQEGQRFFLEAFATATQTAMESFTAQWERLAPSFARVVSLINRSWPTNWSTEIEIEEGAGLAERGWPIVWVPRTEIVRELIDAADDVARYRVLVGRSAEILDDIDAMAGETASPGDDPVVDTLLEAVGAGRHGLWIACQTASTTALDTLVTVRTGIYKQRYDLAAVYDEDDVLLSELRLALILRCIPGAFATFRPAKGDPIPEGYNRHATIHSSSHQQLTQSNALFALLVTTSLLRELHEFGEAEIALGHLVVKTESRLSS